MSDARSQGHARAARRTISRTAQSGLNDLLALVLLVFVALVPIPLGANNPISWSIGAAGIGVIGLIYFSTLATRDQTFRVPPAQYRIEIALWSMLVGYLVVQVLPLDALGIALSVTGIEGQTYAIGSISLTPDATVLMGMTLLGYGLFVFLCLQISANRDRALMVAELALFVFVAHALFGLASLAFFDDSLLIFEKWAYEGVATGTFVNRNSYATFLAIGLALGTGLSLRTLTRRRGDNGQRVPRQDERFIRAGLMVVSSLIILAALMATQSRMGLFAGLAGCLLIVLVAGLKSASRRLRTVLLAMGGTGVLLAIIALGFGSGTLERLGSVESAADVRGALYSQVVDLIRANWLLGTGGGSFEQAYTLFHRWPVSPDRVWDKAHNTYLALWSELGLVFGSIPMIVFGLGTARIIGLIIKRQNDWWLPLIALATIAIIAIHSLVDFSMEIQGVVYAALFVITLGLDKRTPRNRDGQERSSGQ